jgi:hypothetical protein
MIYYHKVKVLLMGGGDWFLFTDEPGSTMSCCKKMLKNSHIHVTNQITSQIWLQDEQWSLVGPVGWKPIGAHKPKMNSVTAA